MSHVPRFAHYENDQNSLDQEYKRCKILNL